MTNEKNNDGFRIPNVWQILKRFTGTFCQAQTLKLWWVCYVFNRLHAQHFFFVFSPDPIPKCHQSQFSGTTHLSHQKPLPLAESHLWHKTSEWCTNTISVVRHHPIKLKFPLNWHSEMNSRFYWLEWSCRYLFENDLILLCPYSPFPSEHLKNFYINSDF